MGLSVSRDLEGKKKKERKWMIDEKEVEEEAIVIFDKINTRKERRFKERSSISLRI